MNKRIQFQMHKLIQMNKKEKLLDNKIYYKRRKNKSKKLKNLLMKLQCHYQELCIN